MADPRSVFRFLGRSGRRVAITVVGFAVLGVGGVMLLTPGPGLLLVIVGLAILGTEYAWAKRLLERAKQQTKRAREKMRRKPKDGQP